MKTSRLESTNGFPRHLRQNRLLRKLLKAHHAATYDHPAPLQHAPQARCTRGYDLAIAEEKKEIAIPEIHITPPPLYHEIPRSAPAVREVPRFRPTIHQPNPDTQPEYSVASLGTTLLTNVPLLLSASQSATLSTETTSHERLDLEAMDLRRCASASTLLPPTTHHPAPPTLRHHRSADNLLLLAGSARHSAGGPTTTTTTLTPASPLGSHPVDPSSPTSTSTSTSTSSSNTTVPDQPSSTRRRRTAAKPPALKRARSYPIIPVSIMTPIREEPRSPKPILTTATASAAQRRLPSILRGSPTSPTSTSSRQRERKRVRFEQEEQLSHECANDDEHHEITISTAFQHDRLVLFAMAVFAASLLLLLAFADDVAGLTQSSRSSWTLEWAWPAWTARVEYAVAFAVGCGVAHWLSASGVAEVVGGTLGRAREEGWV